MNQSARWVDLSEQGRHAVLSSASGYHSGWLGASHLGAAHPVGAAQLRQLGYSCPVAAAHLQLQLTSIVSCCLVALQLLSRVSWAVCFFLHPSHPPSPTFHSPPSFPPLLVPSFIRSSMLGDALDSSCNNIGSKLLARLYLASGGSSGTLPGEGLSALSIGATLARLSFNGRPAAIQVCAVHT